MKQHIVKMENLGSTDSVLTLIVLNWAAPSTYTTAQQSCQRALAGACVNEPNSLGVALTPVFFHKKGQLFKLEEVCNKLLNQANINGDYRFALPFTGKTDERERRTLVQRGRFLLAMDEEISKSNLNLWKADPLVKKPLVEEAALTPTRDLLIIEDVSEDSLPSTTDLTTSINPPEKHQQIGLDAAKKLLCSLTAGLELNTGRSALLVVDLSTHTGEMCKASLIEGEPAKLPVYYLGFTTDDDKEDWARQHLQAWLADQYLEDGGLKLPTSCSLPAKTLPAELQEAAPPLPQLSVLTWCKTRLFEGLASLKTPDSLLTKYWDRARFGAEFQSLIETARKDLPLDLPAESTDKNKKRKVSLGAGQENPPLASSGQSSQHQPGAQGLKAMPVTDLPSALTWEAVLTTNKNVHIVLAIGEIRVFLVHRGDQPQTLEAGTLIAGWFKEKFWQHRDAAGEASKKKAKKSRTMATRRVTQMCCSTWRTLTAWSPGGKANQIVGCSDYAEGEAA